MSKRNRNKSSAPPAAGAGKTCSFLRSPEADSLIVNQPEDSVELFLECRECGRKGRYRVGGVTLDPALVLRPSNDPRSFDAAVGFTGYFVCRQCGSYGPWNLTTHALLVVSAMLAAGHGKAPFFMGQQQLYDGTVIRYAAEGVAILTARIAADPTNAFLHDRLGNLFEVCGLLDRAAIEWTKALELDPNLPTAMHSVAQVHVKANQPREAAALFHRLLDRLRTDSSIPLEDRRRLARSGLEYLVGIHNDSGGEIPLMNLPPIGDSSALTTEFKSATLELRSFDLEREEDWLRMVDTLLGLGSQPVSGAGRGRKGKVPFARAHHDRSRR
jgi:tetratricopeptide (TPR) repeat protein